ncbi:Spo0E family sporulation regulatory protein-aspartic acid phosphatase [Paenibacillus sp. LMG 31456]|uniref:Spo0E family sporulation regulatory protein-aspartic acid phosphatase n=1 Tax=Paenibacillus foliorum TaxID=2654974 RepID=A0A972JZB6_9BACL|nr:aspartyl-phosphate phosphatase Spo0E family protein [Paenibacillus foliorum]NOU94404.1 Spo0E family sporulation regulatory protein-aspartic acid phosphatase [Paenibacillus foliorum]
MDLHILIEQLKIDMINKAQEHNYNFVHPDVIELSQRLDKQLNNYMKFYHAKKISLHTALT